MQTTRTICVPRYRMMALDVIQFMIMQKCREKVCATGINQLEKLVGLSGLNELAILK